RGAHRREELAVRQSLGVSRAAVAVQLLTETGVLALAGGVLGVGIAAAASGALRAAGVDLPRFDAVAVGGRVLLYTLASVVAVTLLCGFLPALRMAGGLAALRGGAARAQGAAGNPLPSRLR